MPTLIKITLSSRTYTCAPIEEVASLIQGGAFAELPQVPMLRLAANFRKRNGQDKVEAYCGIVTLSISNLPGEEETRMVMGLVKKIPHTLLAWRSMDKRSVYVACRLAWSDDITPDSEALMAQLQKNGYQLMHYVYATQLAMNIDTLQPRLDTEVPCCADPEAYFNLHSLPFHVDTESREMPALKIPSNPKGLTLLSGMDEQQTLSFLYHSCYRKALIEGKKKAVSEEEWDQCVAELLARYCYESGLPIGYALSHTHFMPIASSTAHTLGLTFQNAYAKDLLSGINFGHVEKSALLTYQTEAFLNAFYLLRRNKLTGEVQYRERSAYSFDYRPLTEQVMNSMTIRALKAGLGSWDKDVKRLINSNDIEQFDPLADYLYSLPAWDGKDRVNELASRIPCNYSEMPHHLHTWLLSMVAHWLGKDQLHGNAIVPLLIGDQGCGKTTFASLILPPELREYYNDKVDFRSDSDLLTGLSRYALINIDEFDSLKKSQQPTLKYLLSKSEVKFRPSYGKTIEHRRRYASFIATTNLSHPLVDRTGSRRFVCIQVTSGQIIDTRTPIPYEQLYAQLLAEINQGMRYWHDEAETEEVQQHNAPFVRLANLSEILDKILEIPLDETDGEWHSIDEIINYISQNFKYIAVSNATHRDIGKLLVEKGFEHKRSNAGTKHLVIFKTLV